MRGIGAETSGAPEALTNVYHFETEENARPSRTKRGSARRLGEPSARLLADPLPANPSRMPQAIRDAQNLSHATYKNLATEGSLGKTFAIMNSEQAHPRRCGKKKVGNVSPFRLSFLRSIARFLTPAIAKTSLIFIHAVLSFFLLATYIHAAPADDLVLEGWQTLARSGWDTSRGYQKFEEALKLDPANAEALWALGIHHYIEAPRIPKSERHQNRLAAKYFEKLATVLPQQPHGHRALGWTRWHQGDGKSAIKNFEQALVIAPGDLESHRGLAWVLFERKAYDEAEQAFLRGLTIAPRPDGDLLVGRAAALLALQRVPEAMVELRRASMAGPMPDEYLLLPSPTGLRPAAATLDPERRRIQQSSSWRKAAQLPGAKRETVVLAAVASYCSTSSQNSAFEAHQFLLKSSYATDETADLRFIRGVLAISNGNPIKGLEDLIPLIKQEPANPDLWYYYALAAVGQREWHTALKDLGEALRLRPADPRFLALEHELNTVIATERQQRVNQLQAQKNLNEAINKFVVGAIAVGLVAGAVDQATAPAERNAPSVKYYGQNRCITCSGTGAQTGTRMVQTGCWSCGSSGRVYDYAQRRDMLCGRCGGRGSSTQSQFDWTPCNSCSGSGQGR